MKDFQECMGIGQKCPGIFSLAKFFSDLACELIHHFMSRRWLSVSQLVGIEGVVIDFNLKLFCPLKKKPRDKRFILFKS
jgi:hypothetical protein